MSLEQTAACPGCGEDRTFYRSGSMTLHLGEKVKWRCPECGWGFVQIGDSVNTAAV